MLNIDELLSVVPPETELSLSAVYLPTIKIRLSQIHVSRRIGCKPLVLKSRQCEVLQDTIVNELESQYEIANLIQIFSLSQKEHHCLVLQ